MTLTSQNIKDIRRIFSEIKNEEDFLALLNYAKGFFVSESHYAFNEFDENLDIADFDYDIYLSLVDAPKPFSLDLLNYYVNHTNIDGNYERYYTFTIRKKSGGNRLINAPIGNLKLIQRCLNLILQNLFHPHKSATGFVPNKSVVDNARVHTGNNFVYNIDLENFFTSIEQSRVEDCLKNSPFNLGEGRAVIAQMIAGICCEEVELATKERIDEPIKSLKSVLPQGAPTTVRP